MLMLLLFVVEEEVRLNAGGVAKVVLPGGVRILEVIAFAFGTWELRVITMHGMI